MHSVRAVFSAVLPTRIIYSKRLVVAGILRFRLESIRRSERKNKTILIDLHRLLRDSLVCTVAAMWKSMRQRPEERKSSRRTCNACFSRKQPGIVGPIFRDFRR